MNRSFFSISNALFLVIRGFRRCLKSCLAKWIWNLCWNFHATEPSPGNCDSGRWTRWSNLADRKRWTRYWKSPSCDILDSVCDSFDHKSVYGFGAGSVGRSGENQLWSTCTKLPTRLSNSKLRKFGYFNASIFDGSLGWLRTAWPSLVSSWSDPWANIRTDSLFGYFCKTASHCYL